MILKSEMCLFFCYWYDELLALQFLGVVEVPSGVSWMASNRSHHHWVPTIPVHFAFQQRRSNPYTCLTVDFSRSVLGTPVTVNASSTCVYQDGRACVLCRVKTRDPESLSELQTWREQGRELLSLYISFFNFPLFGACSPHSCDFRGMNNNN